MHETNKDVKHPCINCKYFDACGDKSRTERCEGRAINKPKKHKFKHNIQYPQN